MVLLQSNISKTSQNLMSRYILIAVRMFCITIGLYCICQLLKMGVLFLYMFIRSLILNHISEIHWISKFSTSNTKLLFNSNEVSSILVQKV